MVKIEFPFLPPSVNTAYYTDFKTRTRHKTAPYRRFEKELAGYMPREKIEGCVDVEYNFYFPDMRRRDVANYEKCMSDCLVKFGIIEDDSKISRLVLERYYDKGKPYTVVEINAKN